MNIGTFFFLKTQDTIILTYEPRHILCLNMKVEILQIFFSQKELANCYAILDLNIINEKNGYR